MSKTSKIISEVSLWTGPISASTDMQSWLKKTISVTEDEFVQLNFQLVDKERISKINFIKRQNYDVGKNILPNRMHLLNNKIDKNWLDLSLNSIKLKCKDLFMKNN